MTLFDPLSLSIKLRRLNNRKDANGDSLFYPKKSAVLNP